MKANMPYDAPGRLTYREPEPEPEDDLGDTFQEDDCPI
jgi:hypothetical protein